MLHDLHEDATFTQVVAPLPDGGQAILVRVGAEVKAWRNRCPHIGVPLDWGDGRCLTDDGMLICAMHGALFRCDDGFCTDGPCAGDALTPLPIRVADGRIYLETP